MRTSQQRDWAGFGYTTVESAPWKGIVKESLGGEALFGWLDEMARDLAGEGEGRGRRNRFADSPTGERWFIKQYHHGGVLAGEGDVYYRSPDRFYDELYGTLKADEAGVNVPDPVGVFVRTGDEGVEGVYVSRAVEGTLLSRVVRLDDRPDLLGETGKILATLHDAGIDHRDFHVKNCLVSGEDKIVVTDFDPVDFQVPGPWKRSLRVQRFNRSLDKYGFTGDDRHRFSGGYDSVHSLNSTFRAIQNPLLGLKNTMSDVRYALGNNRPWEEIDREKILVRVPNWLGDGVMSLPFLQHLKEDTATGRVDVVVRSGISDLFRHSPAVDRVREITDGKTYSLPPELSEQRYSLAITIPKSLRTGIQLFRSGIPRRLGFKTQGRGMFLTDRVALDGRDRTVHHANLYLDLLELFMDPPEVLPEPVLNLPEAERKESVEKFNLPDRYITIHPGSAYGPAKRWAPDKFNNMINEIIDNDKTVVAIGVASERSVADDVLRNLPEDHVVDLVGETSLAECMAVLDASAGTVANDSGIMHLSSALGTPTVGIFGSSSPELTSPLGPRTRVLYEGVECSPCFERECPLDEDRYKCLTRIHEDTVYKALNELVGLTK